MFEVIRSKRRTIALEVTRDARLIVRAPIAAPFTRIQEVVGKHTAWIRKKLLLMERHKNLFSPKQFVVGEEFFYLGEKYQLKLTDMYAGVILKDFLYVPQHLASSIKDHLISWYKEQAAAIISKRVEYYSALTGLRHNGIRLSNAKTKWGSCSGKNILTFVWRLVMAPLSVIDYVIVHELAHLAVKNHSKKFWHKVQCILPDYKKARHWLKQNSNALLF